MTFQEKLANIALEYDLKLNELQLNNFKKYYDILVETNKIHNLTAITEENDVIFKHFVDSILPIDIFLDNSKIIDIGCGAGFPSIPLKIMNSSLQITAVDSVTKKTDFVKNTVDMLNLADKFEVIHSRIEDLARKKEYREQYDYVVSRAVAPLNIVLEYSAPFLKNGGKIICYKGSNYSEELKTAENALRILKLNVEYIKEYYLKEIDATRIVVSIQKNNTISDKYPRGGNKPRINPL